MTRCRWDDVRVAKVKWLDAPEEHDYPAAASYLSLLCGQPHIDEVIGQWRATKVAHYKAKDILRAARLDLLPRDNAHVAADLKKIALKQSLSPILLVRGDAASGVALQVADGYHRVCASYLTDENTDIPCLIAGPLPA